MSILKLYLTFLKIGFMMFGGAYGGVALFKQVLVDEYGVISAENLEETISLANSVPGPITVNAALMIGYRTGGLTGSIVSLLGLLTPSITLSFTAIALSYILRENPWYRAVIRGITLFVIALLAVTFIDLFVSNVGRSGSLSRAIFSTLTILVAIFLLKIIKTPTLAVMLLGVGLSITYYVLTGN
ncbi:MAG: chromate transporter [Desulfurococcaceae archaeon]